MFLCLEGIHRKSHISLPYALPPSIPVPAQLVSSKAMAFSQREVRQPFFLHHLCGSLDDVEQHTLFGPQAISVSAAKEALCLHQAEWQWG